MFRSLRSARHARSFGSSFGRQSHFRTTNVERVLNAKRGYSRRLFVEPLELRAMLAGDSDDIAAGAGGFFDRFEDNDDLETATVLGSETEITERDLTVFDGDDDFFKVTAHSTGKLVVRTYRNEDDFGPLGLPIGDLDLQIQDVNGNVLAEAVGPGDDEELIIPVVSQQMYFVRVFGDGLDGDLFIGYDLEIENFPAPVPTGVHLDPASDTGALTMTTSPVTQRQRSSYRQTCSSLSTRIATAFLRKVSMKLPR